MPFDTSPEDQENINPNSSEEQKELQDKSSVDDPITVNSRSNQSFDSAIPVGEKRAEIRRLEDEEAFVQKIVSKVTDRIQKQNTIFQPEVGWHILLPAFLGGLILTAVSIHELGFKYGVPRPTDIRQEKVGQALDGIDTEDTTNNLGFYASLIFVSGTLSTVITASIVGVPDSADKQAKSWATAVSAALVPVMTASALVSSNQLAGENADLDINNHVLVEEITDDSAKDSQAAQIAVGSNEGIEDLSPRFLEIMDQVLTVLNNPSSRRNDIRRNLNFLTSAFSRDRSVTQELLESTSLKSKWDDILRQIESNTILTKVEKKNILEKVQNFEEIPDNMLNQINANDSIEK